ncbi:MAG: ABC transporter permease [Hyphomicrobiaceae bacterium]
MAAAAYGLAGAPSRPLRIYRATLRFGRHKPLGALGAAIILILLLCAAIPDLIAPYPYDGFNLSETLTGPSPQHVFGTDSQGRDIASRIVFGARTAMIISIAAVSLATAASLALGITSGLKGSWFDVVLQRFVDIWQAFPGLVFVLFASAVFGSSTATLIFTIAILLTAGNSRLVRAATISVAAQPFIEATRVLGANDLRIAVRHVLPNVLPVVLVNISLQIGAVLLISAALSFLGFGVPPPAPDWGRMLREARSEMQRHPYLALFPGIAISVTVYAFNVLGDALRDILDPRMRG